MSHVTMTGVRPKLGGGKSFDEFITFLLVLVLDSSTLFTLIARVCNFTCLEHRADIGIVPYAGDDATSLSLMYYQRTVGKIKCPLFDSYLLQFWRQNNFSRVLKLIKIFFCAFLGAKI